MSLEEYDKGPWEAFDWSDNGPGSCVVIASQDFKHDVRLIVKGDFESKEQRLAYADALAERLSRP